MFLIKKFSGTEKTRRRRLLYGWLPVGLYCLLIFVQSSFPPAVKTPLFPFADKVAHMGVYAVLGVLFYRAFKTPSLRRGRAVFWAVLASTLYGVSDELHQALVPARSAEMADVMADGIGSLLGVLLFAALSSGFGKPSRRAPDAIRKIAD